MQTINIIGAPGHGKTTLTEALNSLHINEVNFRDANEDGNASLLVIDGTVGATDDFPGGQELLGVFISKADLAEDIEMMELLEMELRESIGRQGLDIELPVMIGSALKALQGDHTSANQLRAFLRNCNIA